MKKQIARWLLKIKPLYQYLSVPQEKKLEYMAGYIDSNWNPLECPKCGCKKTNTAKEYYLDGHILCEYELQCRQCSNPLGYWAYGSWQY
jgi:hypothetical protein